MRCIRIPSLDRFALQRLAEEFWSRVGKPEPFPRQLETAVLWTLPLAVFKLPRLWVRDVREWLVIHGIRFQLETDDRPLRACLLAYAGRGCVFLNGVDSLEEQRFSIAHEVAHFLLDYHYPRLHAVSRLGPAILEVFDGQRPATLKERVHAVLSHVPIGFHTHLMGRQGNDALGYATYATIDSHEEDADHLALELLAPEREVRRFLGRYAIGHPSLAQVAQGILQQDFGLPGAVAAEYAQLLFAAQKNQSVRGWLKQRSRVPGRLSNFSIG